MAFHLFDSRIRRALYRIYKRSKPARFFFVSFALLTQAIMLVAVGMIGLLLGFLVRSLLS